MPRFAARSQFLRNRYSRNPLSLTGCTGHCLTPLIDQGNLRPATPGSLRQTMLAGAFRDAEYSEHEQMKLYNCLIGLVGLSPLFLCILELISSFQVESGSLFLVGSGRHIHVYISSCNCMLLHVRFFHIFVSCAMRTVLSFFDFCALRTFSLHFFALFVSVVLCALFSFFCCALRT